MHTHSVSVNGPAAASIIAYAVCVIHRGRKQMFSQPVFGSPTRRSPYNAALFILYIIWAAAAPALHFCDKSRSVAGGYIIKIGTRPIVRIYLHIPRLWYNTLCTSYNNIIRTHTLSSFYNAALDRNILISYIYYYAYNIYIHCVSVYAVTDVPDQRRRV